MPDPEDHFLLNPYGMMFDEITASSLVKIDMEGNKVEPSDYGVNQAGFVIHSAVHMARHDLVCVLHTHTVAGCAVSCQKEGLLPLNQHALGVIGDVAYHSYEGAATRLDERERILADLGDQRILVLRNHGLLTVGRSIGEAFVATYKMERACFPAIGRRVLPDLGGRRAGRLRPRQGPLRRWRPQRPGHLRVAGPLAQARPHRPVLQAIASCTFRRRQRAAKRRITASPSAAIA